MWRDAALVPGRDLRIEARSRVTLHQVAPFALLVLILFAFALDPDNDPLDPAGGPDPAGHVTSGGPAPFLKKNIAMAYAPLSMAEPGTEVKIGIRSHQALARVVPLPFYKRPR